VPYTLTMGLIWFTVAFGVGVLMGSLLRSLTARREVARVRTVSEDVDPGEVDRLRARIATLESELNAVSDRSGPAGVGTTTSRGSGRSSPPADDLTTIVGIGPHVAELCRGIGILTWRDLAETEVSLLRTLLDDAGSRYRIHDPSTWPAQAELLATGQHEAFAALVDSMQPARSDEPRVNGSAENPISGSTGG
jgi:predicted flap endonuclease-1-like 5' DNA nuclease